MEILAPAKVNLFLELLKRRDDGFHELETIMAPVNLFDRIMLRRRSDETIRLRPALPTFENHPQQFSMPADRSNLIWRAIDLLGQACNRKFGVDVIVEKRIPNQAGMGGGSSDAASTLLAINRMFSLQQTRRQLLDLASQLGSDVAFFIDRGIARCTGLGEIIQPITDCPRLDLVLAMPPTGLSTAQVFQQCCISSTPPSSDRLLQGLRHGSLQQIGQGMGNRLQSTAEQLSPWVKRLVQEFAGLPSIGHQMTGSGSAYFGIFANSQITRQAKRILKNRLPECSLFCVSTVGRTTNVIRYPSIQER